MVRLRRFGSLAGVLAVVLLPPLPEAGALVSVFAVFATSFLARPVGAVVAGVRADRHGRRRALVVMVLLMAGATGAIGLLPPWSAIGALAPVSLIVLRLFQGFSSGGQVTTSIAFLTELPPSPDGGGTAAGTPRRWRWAWPSASRLRRSPPRH